MYYFDPMYFVFLAPALLLAFWAQYRVKSTFAAAQQMPARCSGADAARAILDEAGLQSIRIEQVPGELSDHYDPKEKVLRLSPGVYRSFSLAAVGVAAHEAGHALQHARNYAPLTIRNLAVPVASFGSSAGMLLTLVGLTLSYGSHRLGISIAWLGIALFGGVVFFQLVNLPVEFDASSRAKERLLSLGVVNGPEITEVSRVLNAAAWTYVAATLQAVLTLLYYAMRVNSSSRRD